MRAKLSKIIQGLMPNAFDIKPRMDLLCYFVLLIFIATSAVRYNYGVYFRFMTVTGIEFFGSRLDEVVVKVVFHEVYGATAESTTHYARS